VSGQSTDYRPVEEERSSISAGQKERKKKLTRSSVLQGKEAEGQEEGREGGREGGTMKGARYRTYPSMRATTNI
jgi:hypothetical protein